MKKKNSIEKIKRNTLTFYAKHKSVLKAISAIAAYILVPEIAMWPIKVFVVNNNVFPYIARVIYLLLVDVLLASTLLYIYVDEIMVMFADIKKNNKKYFEYNVQQNPELTKVIETYEKIEKKKNISNRFKSKLSDIFKTNFNVHENKSKK